MANVKGNSYLVLIAVTLLALVSGFIIGNLSPSVIPQKNSEQAARDEGKSFYTSQTATIQGVITKVEGNKITMQNKDGVTGEVEVLDTLLVNKLDQKATSGPLASGSAQINTIETNKVVLVTLKFKDGEYRAATISYLPPPPPVPTGSQVPRGGSTK